MSHKAKLSGPEKITAIEKYLRGEDSLNHLATVLDVHYSTVKQWLQTYQSLGPNALLSHSKNSAYTTEFKTKAVEDYLAGGGSHMDICKRYGIKSKSQLHNWVLKYNGHEKLKASGTGGTPIMTDGRATTYDERVEIVKYCIEHQNNYTETAQKFQVSYQQVYSWTNKYLKDGIDALQDRRGKRKSEDEMSEVEKLRAQNKLLEAENKRKQMEIDLLKKLEEIERRRF
ncbi:MAG TPA: helix-turn-helix domain-containing protein [Desulfitobacterium dehalogenans]|uniref:Helix-turn-helix domain-containing protein n=1 Tax=Desulfitobacterium dehalogenans TaxID=36854 RepID=A0A7C7D922_9FIRM|nr:helix-turn-helix domain-containing protein [Desulfitobacterium dehalogenans]